MPRSKKQQEGGLFFGLIGKKTAMPAATPAPAMPPAPAPVPVKEIVPVPVPAPASVEKMPSALAEPVVAKTVDEVKALIDDKIKPEDLSAIYDFILTKKPTEGGRRRRATTGGNKQTTTKKTVKK